MLRKLLCQQQEQGISHNDRGGNKTCFGCIYFGDTNANQYKKDEGHDDIYIKGLIAHPECPVIISRQDNPHRDAGNKATDNARQQEIKR